MVGSPIAMANRRRRGNDFKALNLATATSGHIPSACLVRDAVREVFRTQLRSFQKESITGHAFI